MKEVLPVVSRAFGFGGRTESDKKRGQSSVNLGTTFFNLGVNLSMAQLHPICILQRLAQTTIGIPTSRSPALETIIMASQPDEITVVETAEAGLAEAPTVHMRSGEVLVEVPETEAAPKASQQDYEYFHGNHAPSADRRANQPRDGRLEWNQMLILLKDAGAEKPRPARVPAARGYATRMHQIQTQARLMDHYSRTTKMLNVMCKSVLGSSASRTIEVTDDYDVELVKAAITMIEATPSRAAAFMH